MRFDGAAQLIGVSPPICDLRDEIDRVARTDAKVLITGESGTGKEVVARQVYALSNRSSRSFVPVNCAGLPETLLESELFGHVRGSFTGAYRDKPGKLQLAHQGTLFLDEVGEMSLRMQALLLRFLENGEIQSIGSDSANTRVDVRVVAATNRNLAELVSTGQFRQDLMYRLRVIHLQVPPLRDRPEDIRLLVHEFVKASGRPVRFSEDAIRVLEQYRWPGNVRELQNVVEQSVWMTGSDIIEAGHLPAGIRPESQSLIATRERRCHVADQLYDALVSGGYSFWQHIHPLLLARDVTRHDMRQLVRRGLTTTRGNYRALLKLFGMPVEDYKRFLNFLAAHDCRPDYREFRNGAAEPERQSARVTLPPLERRADASTEAAQPADEREAPAYAGGGR